MQRTKAPFRADQVGSFLRSEPLKEARAKREKGEISAADLKKVEDTEIEKLIKKQEEIGMQLVTDGEYRRAWWHFDFLEQLGGVEGYEAEQGIQFAGVQTKARGVKVTGKLHFNGHPFVDHFKFVKEHTKVTPKMTIPSPSVLHFRGGRKGISKDRLSGARRVLRRPRADLQGRGRGVLRRPAAATCSSTTRSGPISARRRSATSPSSAATTRRGLPEIYAEVINEAIKDRPSDMTITTHVCRGNFRSTWISEGGYEPVAEIAVRQGRL